MLVALKQKVTDVSNTSKITLVSYTFHNYAVLMIHYTHILIVIINISSR